MLLTIPNTEPKFTKEDEAQLNLLTGETARIYERDVSLTGVYAIGKIGYFVVNDDNIEVVFNESNVKGEFKDRQAVGMGFVHKNGQFSQVSFWLES